MVEEYERVVSCGDRFSRLWVFVFSGNCDDPFEKVGDFGCGARVLGGDMGHTESEPVDMKNFRVKGGSLKGSIGFKKNLMEDCNNTGRKKVSNDGDCLRKLVLKQQLLARQRDQIGNVDCKFGVNVGKYDQPLVDLGPGSWNLSTAKNDMKSESSDSSGRKFHSYEVLPYNDDYFGVISTLASDSHPLSLRDSNLIEEKNPKSCSLHCNALISDVCCGDRVSESRRDSMVNYINKGHGISGHCSTRRHRLRLRDVKDQGLRLSCHKRSRCVGMLGGKFSVGAKCSPMLGILKEGKAMRFYHLISSSRPGYGPRRLSNVRKFNDFSKENIEKQANLSVKRSQLYRYGGGHSPQTSEDPLIDLRKEPFEVYYEDNYDFGTTTECKFDTANTELVESGLICSYGTASEGYASSPMAQLKDMDPTVEVKQLAEREGSSKTVLDSVIGILAQWDKSLSLQEQMQDNPPVSPDDKVVSTKNEAYSNLNVGFQRNLAVLCSHLVTRGLQTIQGSDLEYVKELGSGNYGTVYLGKWKGSEVAIKKIKPRCFNGYAKEENRLVADFCKEAYMLGQLHHPNIVAFYGIVTDGPITELATVTEYMLSGSLKQVLQRKCRTIDRRKRLIIAMDAAFGMEYLHEKRIVHFDLKSHNFLVNMRDPKRPVCKIGDLGLSKIKQRTLVSGGVRGTIPWMAPELFNSSTNLVTEKVDVYSFGIVMWELLTAEEPYADMRSADIIAGIIKGILRPEIPTWCEPSWKSLMERCWSSEPKCRPSFSKIAKELRVMSATACIK